MLKWRTVEPDGQMPSGRPAQGAGPVPAGAASPVSPSQGAPEWPFGENGGRLPTCVRSSGKEMRPLLGSNWISGRATVSPASVLKTSPGYAVGCPAIM